MKVIHVARKPLDPSTPTVASNALEHGTGGLNIDASRLHSPDAPAGRTRHGGGIAGAGTSYELPDVRPESPAGRWPSNLVVSRGAGEQLPGAGRWFKVVALDPEPVTPTTITDDPRVRSWVDSMQFGHQHGTRLSDWLTEQWDEAKPVGTNVEVAAEAIRQLVEAGEVEPVRYEPTASQRFLGVPGGGRGATWESLSRTSMEVCSWWYRRLVELGTVTNGFCNQFTLPIVLNRNGGEKA